MSQPSKPIIIVTTLGTVSLLFLCFMWFSSKKKPVLEVPLQSLSSIDPATKLAAPNTHLRPYTLLHFWASWCGPCKEEMPTLFAAVAKLPDSMNLILVSEDDSAPDALNFLRQSNAKLPEQFLYWDQQKLVSRTLNVSMFPETFIFDSDMHLVRRIAGGMNWLDPVNLNYLQNLK